MRHCIESALHAQPSITLEAFRRAVDPEYGQQERHTDRQFAANVAKLTECRDAALEAMLAELGEDHDSEPDHHAATDQSTPAGDADELPSEYRVMHEKLTAFSKGSDPKQKTLRRSDARPLIAYTRAAWIIDELTREHHRRPEPSELAELIGHTPAVAQNLIDKVSQFREPGGPWVGSSKRKKRVAISVSRATKGRKVAAGSRYASGDLVHSAWRFGWFRLADEAATSVVRTNRCYLHHSRKYAPITTFRSPDPKCPAPPPDRFIDLRLPEQAIFAFAHMARKYEGKQVDGLAYRVFAVTVKISEQMQAKLRSAPNALSEFRKRARDKWNYECDRAGLKRMPFEFQFCLEEESGLHVHGPAAVPLPYMDIFRATMAYAGGYWEALNSSGNHRGLKDVKPQPAPTSRGAGYGFKRAHTPNRSFKGPAIVISSGVLREMKAAYPGIVAAVLEYRATGKPLIPPKTPEERRRDADFFRKRALWKKEDEARHQKDRAEFIAEWRDRLARATDDNDQAELLRELEDGLYSDFGGIRISFGEAERLLGVSLTCRELVARRNYAKLREFAAEHFPDLIEHDHNEAAGASAPARAPTGAPVSAISAAVSGDFAAALSAETAALSAGAPKKAIRKRRRRKPTITPMIAEMPTTMDAPSYAGISPFIRQCFEHIQAVRRGQRSLAAAAETGDLSAAITAERATIH